MIPLTLHVHTDWTRSEFLLLQHPLSQSGSPASQGPKPKQASLGGPTSQGHMKLLSSELKHWSVKIILTIVTLQSLRLRSFTSSASSSF